MARTPLGPLGENPVNSLRPASRLSSIMPPAKKELVTLASVVNNRAALERVQRAKDEERALRGIDPVISSMPSRYLLRLRSVLP